MILELSKGWKPMSPWGGNTVCDSRDVAAATIAAIEYSGTHRDFILAGENLTYKNLWTQITHTVGKPAPLMSAGPLIRWSAGWFGDLVAKFTGTEGDLNSASVAMSDRYNWYDSSRAKAELGYKNRELAETLQEAWEWINDHHLA